MNRKTIINFDKESKRNRIQFLSDFEYIKANQKTFANFQTRFAALCVTVASGKATKTQIKDFWVLYTVGNCVAEVAIKYLNIVDFNKAIKYLFVYDFQKVGWKRSRKRIANVMYKLAFAK